MMHRFILIIKAILLNISLFATPINYPEWADTIENIYIPKFCGYSECILIDNSRDPYDANFYKQIQSIDKLWILESAELLSRDSLSTEKNTRDYIPNDYDINVSSTETLAAIYELEQIKEDNFFIDNKEEYNWNVSPNRLQICEYIRCNGNLPLQVKATLELKLPK
jgi:hypothetical protein